MFNITFNGKEYKVTSKIFAAIMVVVALWLCSFAFCIYTTTKVLTGLPLFAYAIAFVVTWSVEINGKLYAVIKNETVRTTLGKVVAFIAFAVTIAHYAELI